MPVSSDYSSFGEIQNPQVILTNILPSSPAEKAGLKVGDLIVSVESLEKKLEGEGISPETVQNLIKESEGQISLSYKRGTLAPVFVELTPSDDLLSDRRAIGVAMDTMGTLQLPGHLAILEGARTTWLLTEATAVGLFNFFWSAITFNADFSEISGPVGIFSVVSEARSLGFIYLVSLVAVISINLGIINLVPFPALDGGRLLFVAIEALLRRKIAPRAVQVANTLGFTLLILLMVVVTVHDILK